MAVKKAPAGKKKTTAAQQPKSVPRRKPAAAPKRRPQHGGDCAASQDVPLGSLYVSATPSHVPSGAPLPNEAADVGFMGRSPVMFSPAGLMGGRSDVQVFPVQAGSSSIPNQFNLAVFPGQSGGAKKATSGKKKAKAPSKAPSKAGKKPAAGKKR